MHTSKYQSLVLRNTILSRLDIKRCAAAQKVLHNKFLFPNESLLSYFCLKGHTEMIVIYKVHMKQS